MAYLCILASVSLEKATSIRLPQDVPKVASRIEHASHLIVSTVPEIKEAIDGGRPLNTDTWHPLRGFMIHEPVAVQQRADELETLDIAMRKAGHLLYDNDWYQTEAKKVIDLFAQAKCNGEAVVTFLDLSRTVRPNGPIINNPPLKQ